MADKWETDSKKVSPAFWDTLMDQVDQGRPLTNEEIIQYYNDWAKDRQMDETVDANGYGALDILQTVLDELFPAKDSDRTHVTILDVGACTGNSGQRLYEMGFRQIDALDPSAGSLRVAEQRGVYRSLHPMPLTAQPLDIPPDSYDLIVLVGVMGPSHIPVEAFTEMIRLVKPGGYIINLTRADFLERCTEYASQWQPAIQGHVTSGKWRLVKDQHYDKHYGGRDGFLHVFQVC